MSAEPAVDKAALLLLTLGTDEAAEVLKHLGPREVQRVGLAMARLRPQARDKVEALLDELEAHCAKGSPVHADEAQIRAMLSKALGDERASKLIPQVLPDTDSTAIDGLKWMDARSAAELIQHEHPQIIAAILAHLEYAQASEILKFLGERLRNDVILRIATLDGVQPVAFEELDAALARMLASAGPARRTGLGGVRHAAEILQRIGGAAESAAIDSVRDHDPALAGELLDELHGFEKLQEWDDRDLRTFVPKIPAETLVAALKGAAPDLQDKLLASLPAPAAERLREDLATKGPVSVAAVEAAQQHIVELARNEAGGHADF